MIGNTETGVVDVRRLLSQRGQRERHEAKRAKPLHGGIGLLPVTRVEHVDEIDRGMPAESRHRGLSLEERRRGDQAKIYGRRLDAGRLDLHDIDEGESRQPAAEGHADKHVAPSAFDRIAKAVEQHARRVTR